MYWPLQNCVWCSGPSFFCILHRLHHSKSPYNWTLSLGFVDVADSEWEDIDYDMNEIDKMVANAYPQAHGTLCCLLTYVGMVSVCTMLWTWQCTKNSTGAPNAGGFYITAIAELLVTASLPFYLFYFGTNTQRKHCTKFDLRCMGPLLLREGKGPLQFYIKCISRYSPVSVFFTGHTTPSRRRIEHFRLNL